MTPSYRHSTIQCHHIILLHFPQLFKDHVFYLSFLTLVTSPLASHQHLFPFESPTKPTLRACISENPKNAELPTSSRKTLRNLPAFIAPTLISFSLSFSSLPLSLPPISCGLYTLPPHHWASYCSLFCPFSSVSVPPHCIFCPSREEGKAEKEKDGERILLSLLTLFPAVLRSFCFLLPFSTSSPSRLSSRAQISLIIRYSSWLYVHV